MMKTGMISAALAAFGCMAAAEDLGKPPARLATDATYIEFGTPDTAVLNAPHLFGLPRVEKGHSYVRKGAEVLEIINRTGRIVRKIGPMTGLEK